MQTAAIIRDVFPDVVAEEIIEYFIPRFGTTKMYAKYGVVELSDEFHLAIYDYFPRETIYLAIKNNDEKEFLKYPISKNLSIIIDDLIYMKDAHNLLKHIKIDMRRILEFQAKKCIEYVIENIPAKLVGITCIGFSRDIETFNKLKQFLQVRNEDLFARRMFVLPEVIEVGNVDILKIYYDILGNEMNNEIGIYQYCNNENTAQFLIDRFGTSVIKFYDPYVLYLLRDKYPQEVRDTMRSKWRYSIDIIHELANSNIKALEWYLNEINRKLDIMVAIDIVDINDFVRLTRNNPDMSVYLSNLVLKEFFLKTKSTIFKRQISIE